jgi:thymidine kinase
MFSVRLVADAAAQVVVGGEESYQPACRACYLELQQQQQQQPGEQ